MSLRRHDDAVSCTHVTNNRNKFSCSSRCLLSFNFHLKRRRRRRPPSRTAEDAGTAWVVSQRRTTLTPKQFYRYFAQECCSSRNSYRSLWETRFSASFPGLTVTVSSCCTSSSCNFPKLQHFHPLGQIDFLDVTRAESGKPETLYGRFSFDQAKVPRVSYCRLRVQQLTQFNVGYNQCSTVVVRLRVFASKDI